VAGDAAHAGRRAALAIHEDLDDPAADHVRAKLARQDDR
jgi:hypothetical protein